ncbi:NACHT domain-containing protein [Aeromonas veronii]|uniref:NACHT domain-containing protein n=1 Tax=Aeromonas veronii TaxID=654 RepID=UPI0013168D8B|nr:NACHT domain-containing protein [Aeromonas veronii]MDO2434863.1 NACHT domain-containing protein [Aeromonas veronii]QHB81848.1 NACHT domain-containing protein [Aeromonas veronii]
MDMISFKIKSLFTILLLSILIVTFAYISSGFFLSITLSIIIISALYFTKDIWLPYKDGKTKVRIFSLKITYLTTLIFCSPFFNNYFVQNFLNPTYKQLKQYYPLLPDFNFNNGTPSILLIVFTLTSVFIVNFLMRDKTITGTHPSRIDEEFQEKSYNERLQSFCRVLDNNLNDIDISTNWSSEFFVPLEAEVEIKYGHKKKRKIMDLINAVRSDKTSRVFLILGDPGSGKSVSLRRLCKQMLSEVNKTGRVPIYVNLKEWTSQNTWSEESPPTQDDLYTFIVQNLKDRLDFFGNEFIDAYFNKMFENGRFFFILDSFDEIPSVMDVDESSWLIDRLSSLLYNFLAGAHESRGILSSRIYRKPTSHFKTNAILEIRPFSDLRIKESLEKSIKLDSKTIRNLFKEKPQFISVARNPFSAALIKNYANLYNGELPNNISELYSSYIKSRLNGSIRKIERKGLSIDDITKTASKIAIHMFKDPSFGLEAPVDALTNLLPDDKVQDVIDILTYVRLGRVGDSDERLFSFSHRRFNEYFVAIEMLATDQPIIKNSIPTDSRWRDALVMYCEIANDQKATEIANFCWDEIKLLNDIKINDPQYIRSIHCIRFLKDAFRSRRECLSNFDAELEELIKYQVSSDTSIVTKKIAVEALGIINESSIDEIICKAMEVKSSWVQNEAFKSCRYLKSLTPSLSLKIINYISKYSIVELLKNKDELLFSLSLSSAFSSTLLLVKVRLFIISMNITGYFILLILFPELLFLYIFVLIIALIFRAITTRKSHSTMEPFFQTNFLLISSLVILTQILPQPSPLNNARIHLFDFGAFNLMSNLDVAYLPQFISIIAVAMIIPFYDIGFVLLRLKMLKIRDVIEYMIVLLGASIAIILPLYLFNDYLHDLLENHRFAVTLILFVIPLVQMLKGTYERVVDYIDIKNITITKNFDRTLLLSIFERLKTNWGRYRLVTLLDNERSKLTGEWKDNIFPDNLHDDAASLLAKIEEKSMGFD